MLGGDLRERRGQPTGGRRADGRHPVEPPDLVDTTQLAHHGVERLDQIREMLRQCGEMLSMTS